MNIAFDTNVLIYFFESIEPQSSKTEKLLNSVIKGQCQGIISTITIAEVLTGFYLAGNAEKAAKAKRLLNDWGLNGFKIIPVTFEIADLAASLRAKSGGRLPDALIVATALDQAADCIYSQDKDLQRFSTDVNVNELPQER